MPLQQLRDVTGEKGIKIGIISSENLLHPIENTIKQFPNLSPTTCVYCAETDVPKLTTELLENADVEVLLFSDPYSHRIAKKRVETSIPFHYIPLTGTGLYRALYRAQKRYGWSSFSLDTVSQKAAVKTIVEMGELPPRIEHYSCHDQDLGNGEQEHQELLEFHRLRVVNGNCTFALTAVPSVAFGLSKQNIPNELLLPTEQDIVITLERALLATQTRRMKESQIIVGLIAADPSRRIVDTVTSENRMQLVKLEIHQLLLEFAEVFNGNLVDIGGNEYMFITTRGILEKETGGYKFLPMANKGKLRNLTLSIGIGFGHSANEAGSNAREALRIAKEAGNLCLIVREDKSVIGPLEMNEPSVYDLSLIDIEFLKQAEAFGLRQTYLARIIHHVTRHGKIDFYAKELSDILGITVRSIHRLLLNWIDAGIVEIIGEERKGGKGRPNLLYRLSFMLQIIR